MARCGCGSLMEQKVRVEARYAFGPRTLVDFAERGECNRGGLGRGEKREK